jgi:hypothetical protein
VGVVVAAGVVLVLRAAGPGAGRPGAVRLLRYSPHPAGRPGRDPAHLTVMFGVNLTRAVGT